MSQAKARLPLLAFLLSCLVTTAGCGKSAVTVTGKLVPPPGVKLVETDAVTVQFAPEDGKGPSVFAQVTPADGTFVTKEILPGKYKVAVQIQAYQGMPESEKRGAAFEPVNKTFSEQTTKATYEVTSDPQQSITIDLAKGSVTKG